MKKVEGDGDEVVRCSCCVRLQRANTNWPCIQIVNKQKLCGGCLYACAFLTFPMYHLSSVFSTLKTGCANSYGALPFQSADFSWYRSLDRRFKTYF